MKENLDIEQILSDLRSFGRFRAAGVTFNMRAINWAVMAYFRGMVAAGVVPSLWVTDLRDWSNTIGSYEAYLHYVRMRLDVIDHYRGR